MHRNIVVTIPDAKDIENPDIRNINYPVIDTVVIDDLVHFVVVDDCGRFYTVEISKCLMVKPIWEDIA